MVIEHQLGNIITNLGQAGSFFGALLAVWSLFKMMLKLKYEAHQAQVIEEFEQKNRLHEGA